MKARLVPVFFVEGRDEDFDIQLGRLKALLAEEGEFLDPVGLEAPLPEAEAVVFPQFLGEAYRKVKDFKSISIPMLVITSEFGTVSMWDWEIRRYLKTEGVETIAPYNLDQTTLICKTLSVKRQLNKSKLLVFQDHPGVGNQSSILAAGQSHPGSLARNSISMACSAIPHAGGDSGSPRNFPLAENSGCWWRGNGYAWRSLTME